jgi:hypothetical protein
VEGQGNRGAFLVLVIVLAIVPEAAKGPVERRTSNAERPTPKFQRATPLGSAAFVLACPACLEQGREEFVEGYS